VIPQDYAIKMIFAAEILPLVLTIFNQMDLFADLLKGHVMFPKLVMELGKNVQ